MTCGRDDFFQPNLPSQLNFMGTKHQFLMLTDSPAKEEGFQEAKRLYSGKESTVMVLAGNSSATANSFDSNDYGSE